MTSFHRLVITVITNVSVRVCVCVCLHVIQKKREREGGRGRAEVSLSPHSVPYDHVEENEQIDNDL